MSKARYTNVLPKPFAKAPSAADPAIAELLQMHTYRRPYDGKTVKKFCAKYLDTLPGISADKKGNRIVRIGTAPVLWSSHTDTVHKSDGSQKLLYGNGLLYLDEKSDSNCLGADCTVGVWLMRQMILRNIPGLYIFHHGEEVGGIGSSYISDKTPELLTGIDYAIAFDRKGTTSVITHQFSRCASDTFGKALAAEIGPEFKCDDSGTFTDTANYTDLVPECTNISVGYFNQHTASECLDVSFAAYLLNRICALDVAALPVSRVAGTYDKESIYTGHAPNWPQKDETLFDLVFRDPQTATKILDDLGISVDDFMYYQWEAENVRK